MTDQDRERGARGAAVGAMVGTGVGLCAGAGVGSLALGAVGAGAGYLYGAGPGLIDDFKDLLNGTPGPDNAFQDLLRAP